MKDSIQNISTDCKTFFLLLLCVNKYEMIECSYHWPLHSVLTHWWTLSFTIGRCETNINKQINKQIKERKDFLNLATTLEKQIYIEIYCSY